MGQAKLEDRAEQNRFIIEEYFHRRGTQKEEKKRLKGTAVNIHNTVPSGFMPRSFTIHRELRENYN